VRLRSCATPQGTLEAAGGRESTRPSFGLIVSDCERESSRKCPGELRDRKRRYASDKDRIGTAQFTTRRQSSSPISKRVVQSMTMHTRQCEYGPYCLGRKPSLTGLACKHTRDLSKSQIGYV